MGELVNENLDGDLLIKNPATVIPQSDNVALVPLLPIVEEKEITITQRDRMFGEIFTPLTQVTQHYKNMFGVGLTVVEKPAIITP